MSKGLSELEEQFVEEAEAGGFLVGYNDNGRPYALGATKTDNLFSMEVVESPDGEGSMYTLYEEDDA